MVSGDKVEIYKEEASGSRTELSVEALERLGGLPDLEEKAKVGDEGGRKKSVKTP